MKIHLSKLNYATLSVCLLLAAAAPALTAANRSSASVSAERPLAEQEFIGGAAPPSIDVSELVTAGLSFPVSMADAGDGSGRLFIVEQSGFVRIVSNGALSPQPFLDVSEMVAFDYNEQGLVGLAFHPHYAQNGIFFIYYTRQEDGAAVLARYRVSAADPQQADPASAETLLLVQKDSTFHHAGQLAFGQDGYLYVSIGDGGPQGDVYGHAQNIESLRGKILRINVDQADENAGTLYSIPPDNPFVGKPGRDEIWLYGLRNPWRFSFDRQTGDLFIGDVGNNHREEVDYWPAASGGGANFGWHCLEGTLPAFSSAQCNVPAAIAGMVTPLAEYSHDIGASVTGGYVYRGALYPELQGRYFYADFANGSIWSFGGSLDDGWETPYYHLAAGYMVSSFGQDAAGELYVLDYRGGTLRRLAAVSKTEPDLRSSSLGFGRPFANPGETLTVTTRLLNTGASWGAPLVITETLSAGLFYQPGSLAASAGTVQEHTPFSLGWSGSLSDTQAVTLTFQVRLAEAAMESQVVRGALAVIGESLDLPMPSLLAVLQTPSPRLGTTAVDFRLPGTQPGELVEPLLRAAGCDYCHTDLIYKRWQTSMMGQAGQDPLFWAALEVANIDAENAGVYCLRCHAISGWLAGRVSASDGSELLHADIINGLTCEACHRLVDSDPASGGEAVDVDAALRAGVVPPAPASSPGSAISIIDPLDRRRGPYSLGVDFPNHPRQTYQTDFLGGNEHDSITRSRLCGSCHNVSNPALSWDEGRGQYWPNGLGDPPASVASEALFPVETTYYEWLYSSYPLGVLAPLFTGDDGRGVVSACTDCHMPRRAGYAADLFAGPVYRDCQAGNCLPEHAFAGGNAWLPRLLQNPAWRLHDSSLDAALQEASLRALGMLHKAARLEVTLQENENGMQAIVRVINESGHKLPTGYAEGRRMWLHLRAYDAAGNLVYESGGYDGATGDILNDAQLKVYEVKQGLTPELAAVLGLPAGESFHFVLNNTVVKDNRIPPRGFSQAAYDRPGLRPVEAAYADGQYWDDTVYKLPAPVTQVMVELVYQAASGAYVRFLENHGGVDAQTLSTLAEQAGFRPALMAYYPDYRFFLPLLRR